MAGFCYALEEQLEAAGIDVRTMNPEYGDGQLEITVSPSWGVSAADDASTFKTAVKEVAMQFGATATFMTKPFSLSGPGNGGHFNFSLWEPEGAEAASGALGREGAERGPCHVGKGDERGGGGGFCSEGLRNALHDTAAPAGLSPPPQQRLAGRLPEFDPRRLESRPLSARTRLPRRHPGARPRPRGAVLAHGALLCAARQLGADARDVRRGVVGWGVGEGGEERRGEGS